MASAHLSSPPVAGRRIRDGSKLRRLPRAARYLREALAPIKAFRAYKLAVLASNVWDRPRTYH